MCGSAPATTRPHVCHGGRWAVVGAGQLRKPVEAPQHRVPAQCPVLALVGGARLHCLSRTQDAVWIRFRQFAQSRRDVDRFTDDGVFEPFECSYIARQDSSRGHSNRGLALGYLVGESMSDRAGGAQRVGFW